MCQLMGDHIMGELSWAIRQVSLEDHAPTAVSRFGARYPNGASPARNMIIQRQSKARVIEEIGKHRPRQPFQHRYDAGRQRAGPYRSLDVQSEVLNVRGPVHIPVITVRARPFLSKLTCIVMLNR